MDKKDFVKKCGELLNAAKPNLVKCEYQKDEYDGEFAVVTCENGAEYRVCITGDSLVAIVTDIFNKTAFK